MKHAPAWIVWIASLIPFAAWGDPIPSPWSDADIGTVGIAGSTAYTAATGTFTVKGSGADIFGTADGFHYLSQPVSGNFTFVARITSAGGTGVNGGAAAGIMVRESLAANSRHVILYLEPGGIARTVWRATTGGASIRVAVATTGYPQWLRLRRYNDAVSLDYSADGTTWKAFPGQAFTNLAFPAYVGLAVTARNNAALNTAVFDHVSLSPLNIPTATSWIGNSYGGGKQYVQFRAQAIAADPATGNLFLNGSSESSSTTFFDTAGNFLSVAANSHFNGSNAIAWDGASHLVWVAQAPYNGSTGKGGVASYTLDGTATGSVLNTATSGQTIVGLAAFGGFLYAVDSVNVATPSDTAHVTVHVINLGTKAETRSFLVPAPARNAVVDNAGYLWIVFPQNGATAPIVRRYSNTGVLQAQQITGLGKPMGIAVDSPGNIYVADAGPDQQVKVYSTGGTLLRRLGDLGGIYGGTPGRTAASKLDHPCGVAVDAAGNLYVACDGPDGIWGDGGSGLVLRKYTSTTALSASTLAWERLGLEYVDCAAADPATDGVDVYTKFHHYVVDDSKGPGKGWTYVGDLVDDQSYPADPRLLTKRAGVWVRTIGGKKFLIDNDQQGGAIYFYRFQSGSEFTVPYASFTRETARGSSTNALAIWVDRDLDGTADSGETDTGGQALGAPSNEVYAWDVDANGDVWTMGGGNNKIGGVQQPTKIWHFRASIGANGYPSYSSADCESFALPAEFTGANTYVVRLHYVPATDTMYLSGYTTALPKPDTRWGVAGTQLLRYDNWRGVSGARSLAWDADLPYSATDGIRAIDAAGGIVAAVGSASHVVTVYDAETGDPIDAISPGPEVAGSCGNIDCNNGITVYQRANGEYLIAVEEDNEQKVLTYRWNPWVGENVGSAPAGTGTVSINAATGTFTLSGSGVDIWGSADAFFYCHRAMTGDGQIVARLASITGSNPSAKGGIMIRESLAANARYADLVITPGNLLCFQWRAATGGSASTAQISGAAPRWLKLARAGNSFTAFYSSDGTAWTQLGTAQTLAMGTEVQVGLPVTAHDNHSVATAVVDGVSTTP